MSPYLQISFCGYKVLNWYERLAWLPVLLVFVVALGVGGKHLTNPPAAEPATVSAILSFASTIAGFVITYSPLSSDFTSYFQPGVSRCVMTKFQSVWLIAQRSVKIFLYSYIGFLLPIVGFP